jgi:NADPH-dependent glutamate synthase beta subunit-like oxidoreductase
VGIDVPRYVRYIAEGKFDEALAVIREKVPFPSVLGYICTRLCEAECRRGEVSQPIAIRALKRAAAERGNGLWKENLPPVTFTGKKVAIVGSGAAGLTAAYYLARRGHQVTIFEAGPAPGGMLRTAIPKKRLSREALKQDIEEILQMGVNLQLNTHKTSADELFAEGFEAVFLATGITYVGVPDFRSEKDTLKLTPQGSIAVDPETLATSREGVFAGGDLVIGGISEDFIQCTVEHWDEVSRGQHFVDILVDQIALHRGDSSHSVIRAIDTGRRAASAIDSYLGGEGIIEETLLETEEPDPWLGRDEGFADWACLARPYSPPPPQLAGQDKSERPLSVEAAMTEARRCLRCHLRALMSPVVFPPEKWLAFNAENVSIVPDTAGVYQLLDEEKKVFAIKGVMNLRQDLGEQLETNEQACYFIYEEDEMYTKRESELLQQYLQQYGEMPGGGMDDLDDLF